jgi:thiamine-monophosphate kinase
MTPEFSLIEKYFKDLTSQRDDVFLGIGDDCALLTCQEGQAVAVSIDTLVEGVHFFADVDPTTLGHKSLAVGLSDLAAMGAKPAWFTLALTLPDVNEDWLQGFSQGLADLAKQFDVQLVGGDTTSGPLAISIQVHGHVDPKQSPKRSGAQVGDLIYVTGTLGDAGLALQAKLGQFSDKNLSDASLQYLNTRLEKPSPRVEVGQQLLGLVTSAIDISDGLSADLSHILKASNVGATIELNQIPLSKSLQEIDTETAYQQALTAGDDYELCFTVPVSKRQQLEASLDKQCKCIGYIEKEQGLRVKKLDDRIEQITGNGYDHFA